MFGEKGFYCLCITCCVIRLSGVNGFGFFIVCVLIVMCNVIGTISESVVCVFVSCAVCVFV